MPNRLLRRLSMIRALQWLSKEDLLELLKKPDPEVVDLVWESYLKHVFDIRDLMMIVYNDDQQFPEQTRLIAGKIILSVIKSDHASMFLRGEVWDNPDSGRLAYLTVVIDLLPDLALMGQKVVYSHLSAKEQNAFMLWNTRIR